GPDRGRARPAMTGPCSLGRRAFIAGAVATLASRVAGEVPGRRVPFGFLGVSYPHVLEKFISREEFFA
ncbi:MAG: hypothetical protein WCP67_09320, partial [Verrucomicrobiota bacterium]